MPNYRITVATSVANPSAALGLVVGGDAPMRAGLCRNLDTDLREPPLLPRSSSIRQRESAKVS